jgi:hypothetical protein
MGLWFTVAAGPRQGDSWSYFTVPNSIHSSTWRARSPYLYFPGKGWPSYIPKHWVPFSSSLTTRRATVELFDTASTWDTDLSYNRSSLHTRLHCRLRTKNIENISHVIPWQLVHWRDYFCLATSYNICPLRHIFHCYTFERVYRAVA